jgi:hypothetical protein
LFDVEDDLVQAQLAIVRAASDASP